MTDHSTYQKKEVALRDRWIQFIHALQNTICDALERTDGAAHFIEDDWQRTENGGGGKSRIIENGQVFEKGGVNTSVVYGSVSDAMRTQLKIDGSGWFACGLSLVLHPLNPFIPTVHANWRYFELYDETGDRIDRWFGGGTDLTPCYLFKEDANHFHGTLKRTLDPFGVDLYQQYKQHCDMYFANHHRNGEMRGIGGIFYDYLRPADDEDAENYFVSRRLMEMHFWKLICPLWKKEKQMHLAKKKSCGRKSGAGDMWNSI